MMLPEIHEPSDDPVVAALEILLGQAIRFPERGNSITLAGGDGANWPHLQSLCVHRCTEPSQRDHGRGHVFARFGTGGRTIAYQNLSGRPRLRLPGGIVPETTLLALEGRPLSEVARIPGLAGWTIGEIGYNAKWREVTIDIVQEART